MFVCTHAKSLRLCLTLCNTIGYSLQLLCPWDSPGKNTGVGYHALIQGIFLTQGSNPHLFCLLHWQAGSSATIQAIEAHKKQKEKPRAGRDPKENSFTLCL